ncbi:TPA: hypothetical protein DCZ36_01525 [Candidatus Gracilibacteria bacterium]|nr:hypothetical protein [Candidatus Gracilibacteria bacterium]
MYFLEKQKPLVYEVYSKGNNLINSERKYNTNIFYPLINTFMQKILTVILLLMVSMLLSSSPMYAQNLTKNDQLFREDIRYRLDARLQTQIMTVINQYKAKIAKIDKSEADKLTESIIGKVEDILYKMRAAQPLDKNLEKKADNKYLAYMLIKFELMLLK